MAKNWISNARLRSMAGRLSYDEIAEANYQATGWRPTRATVQKHLAKLDVPARFGSRTDLLPKEWGVLPEHHDDPERFMLQAVSRARANPDREPSETDAKWIYQLYDLLEGGRGPKLCIGYHQGIGFYYTRRRPGIDLDIIRELDA